MPSKALQVPHNTMAKPDRRYWGTRGTMGSELRYMYSIGLLDLETNEQVSIDGADPAYDYRGRGEPWFTFPTPPSQYEITEPAATTIIPTQDGGLYVESQGNVFKDIRIGGTVGLRPNPYSSELVPGLEKATGVSLNVPRTVQQLDSHYLDERGLRPPEITGLDDITFLRNIFRYYADAKRSNTLARKTVMCWMYAKEGEWYIVEPISFSSTRDSSNPLSWNYSIQLRTIYRFDEEILLRRDPIDNIQKLFNGWDSVKRATRDLAKAVNQISTGVHFALQLPANLTNDLLSSTISLLSSVANLRSTGETTLNFNRGSIKNIMDQAAAMKELAYQIEYGQSAGDIRVFGNQWDLPAPDATDNAALDIHRNIVIDALKKIEKTARRLHAVDSLFVAPKQAVVTDYSRKYLEDGEKQTLTSSPLNPGNISVPDSVIEVDVTGDIRAMAKQHLGDDAKWKSIAILNDLTYPYISTTSSPGVLSPGDKILIPKESTAGDMLTVDETVTDAAQQDLSPVLRKYGRDIRLSDSSAGTDYADLSVGQNGDLALIDGTNNVSQAMMIKFSTEQGELPTHPSFGAKYPVGTKLLLGRIQEFAINTRRTLTSDPRVDSMHRLKIFADGDVLNVSARVKLKQSDVTLPVEFSVRRS